MRDFTASLRPAQPDGPTMLSQERMRSGINSEQLAQHLLAKNGFLERQKKILDVLSKHSIFIKQNQLNLARPDRYYLALARAKQIRRLVAEHKWDRLDVEMAEYLVDEMSPFALNSTMFLKSMQQQCNEQQRACWLPKINSFDVLGCYAQTELGHGSNVKGLECEARWDQQTKTFVIHSPTLTASKWWNGSLGRTANHAVVVAQLLLPSGAGFKSYGPHQFIVQIRDMKTHQPLDGIVIGDIGPKYGYATMDNGYMLFQHHRVPHSALLSKYTQVDPNTGTYTKPQVQQVVYGTMTAIRADIVEHARLILARAVTIAIRYTSIRRQFKDRDESNPSAPELVVLDYPTVQMRLFPLLATTFALHYTGLAMRTLYESNQETISRNDFSALAETHALSSGLKALCTMLAADGIETSRRALGGHGFGGGSGMIPLNSDYLSKPTVEGDNYMITQQTASYLIKAMERAKRQPSAQCDATQQMYQEYLSGRAKAPLKLLGGDDDDAAIVRVFELRACVVGHQVYQAKVENGRGWTSLMVELHELSIIHSEMLLVRNYFTALQTRSGPPLSDKTWDVMRLMFKLFSLKTILTRPTEFLASGLITVDEMARLKDEVAYIMAKLRPHAVSLVDAWKIPDYLLQSALGSYDGDVYNRLFKQAHEMNPLNKLTFNTDWRSEEVVLGEGVQASQRKIEELVWGNVSPASRSNLSRL
ncbi:hypothetical protein AYO21_02428 [Fonsecaea monophora]|uniref:Acyl-coenzyme A oxidase n=1 Tax=Fonsecaea monophora TaxID=254056 RepID=A0A177FIB0_9EURO|nr:hypothetical protein AYO21_02428 [Fonsecaea monophora]OAG43491.1 hypothetical protein AYO21_02428 [Fonsecaea monophora]